MMNLEFYILSSIFLNKRKIKLFFLQFLSLTLDILYISMLIYIGNADVAKLADAPDLGSGPKGWGFKSSHPHQ